MFRYVDHFLFVLRLSYIWQYGQNVGFEFVLQREDNYEIINQNHFNSWQVTILERLTEYSLNSDSIIKVEHIIQLKILKICLQNIKQVVVKPELCEKTS